MAFKAWDVDVGFSSVASRNYWAQESPEAPMHML